MSYYIFSLMPVYRITGSESDNHCYLHQSWLLCQKTGCQTQSAIAPNVENLYFARTVLLVIIGSFGIFAFETDAAFFGSQLKTGILRAAFQSINTRSAGFNTCDISLLSPASLFLMILPMVIGGSPGSTVGGLKTTTFAVLWRTMTSGFSQSKNVEILKRTIPQETIQKAITLLLFYFVLLSAFVMVLLVTENLPVINIIFEAVSAMSTVGLSMGITSKLTEPGRFIIMILMFAGRLGLLTIGYALVFNQHKADYTYAEERVMIG
jgi:trk system potassium uptake protein